MAFLGTLGKIGRKIAKGIGKLGTLGEKNETGQSPLGALSNIGGVLGQGATKSRTQNIDEALIAAQLNAANNQAGLNAAQFNLGAPGALASQVARGDVLSTMQNAPRLGDPRIDKFAGGGLRPSAFGAPSRQAGTVLSNQALQKLQSGLQFTPQITAMPKSGMLEKLGGLAGTIGGVTGVLNENGILSGTPASYQPGRNYGYSQGVGASGIMEPISGLPLSKKSSILELLQSLQRGK